MIRLTEMYIQIKVLFLIKITKLQSVLADNIVAVAALLPPSTG